MSPSKRPSLRVDFQACSGCRACTLACAIAHEHRAEIHRGRIRVRKRMPELETPVFKPTVCRMCRNAKCVAACPTGALLQDAERDLVTLDPKLCDGCGRCVTACPFGAIWTDGEGGTAIKCDLCGGDPVCVRYCSPRALTFG